MVYLLKTSLGGVIKNSSKLYMFLSLVYQNSMLIKHYKVTVVETVEFRHIYGILDLSSANDPVPFLSKIISNGTCEK